MAMQQPRSPYQVLNVSPDAEAEVIEAAYKALMKKYHPDKLVGGPPLSEHKAAELNDAYRIIRDPARRARHDADERMRRAMNDPRGAASEGRAAEAASQRNRPPPPPPPPPMPRGRSVVLVPRRRTGQRVIGWAGSIAALVIIGMAVAQTQGWSGFGTPSLARGFALPTRDDGSGMASTTPVSRERIAEALAEYERVRMQYGPIGIAAYSDACFDAQSRSRSPSELDFCVAFDHAASAYAGSSAAELSAPPKQPLSGEQLDSRHAGEAKLLPGDYAGIEERLDQIKAVTYATLARRGASSEAAAAPAPATAGASARPRPTTQRAAQAPRREAQPRRGSSRREDADFLEREGGIY